MDDVELEKLAREEILKEAKRAKSRADLVGPQGWQKCPLIPTNKRFLQNTLFSVLGSNMKKNTSKKNKLQDDLHNRGKSEKSKCTDIKEVNKKDKYRNDDCNKNRKRKLSEDGNCSKKEKKHNRSSTS